MFKNKKTKTENQDVQVASNVTMSPALAEIIQRKKNGESKPKKEKAKKVDVKDISDIPKDLLLINRKPKIAPTISLIIDRELRDKAREILMKDKRTMTEFVYSKLKELVDGENK